jgi:hypothetical protein
MHPQQQLAGKRASIPAKAQPNVWMRMRVSDEKPRRDEPLRQGRFDQRLELREENVLQGGGAAVEPHVQPLGTRRKRPDQWTAHELMLNREAVVCWLGPAGLGSGTADDERDHELMLKPTLGACDAQLVWVRVHLENGRLWRPFEHVYERIDAEGIVEIDGQRGITVAEQQPSRESPLLSPLLHREEAILTRVSSYCA